MRVIFGLAISMLCIGAANAAPIVLDFNVMPLGNRASYTESGVTIATTDGTEFFAADTPNSTRGILSALNANGDRVSFRADIAGGASFVAVDLGDYGADPDTLFLSVYSSSDLLLDTTTLFIDSSVQSMQSLSLSASNIAYAIFGSTAPSTSGSSVYADNFKFEPADPSAVPEPASLALMGLGGIGMIGGAIRKRRKTTVAA